MIEQIHRSWRIVCAVAALAALAGCACVEPPVASDPPESWLVEQTAWAWVAGQPEEDYRDREEFFATPPTHPVLINLQEQSQKYGYNFPALRADAWAWVENVEHAGQ